jgi:hypothetical protein
METRLRNERAAASTAAPSSDVLAAPVFGRRNLAVAIILFVVALVLLWAFEVRFGIRITGVSNAPHFIYQAESFLHGRWDLDLGPRVTDIVVLGGKDYIVYPPFPALLLLPFVAIFGLATSDILFTTVLSALNLPLLYLLLEQVRANGLTRRPWPENLLLSLFFFYGSINLWLSLGGRMWFTAQVVCVTCTLLSLLLAFRRHFAWSAVLLGCAFFSRATVLLGFPFLAYLAWQDAGTQRLLERFVASLRARQLEWQAVPWRRLLPVAAVTSVVLILFMARNALLFGSPFESGYDILIHQRYPVVTTGPFNIRYVPVNLVANFFTFPRINFTGPFDRHPVFDMLNGGVAVSVFITTPLLLFLFWRNQHFSALRAALWGTLGLVVAAVLLFHAAGWYQFGARYLYDGYPYAFLLLALNEMRVDWRFALLGLVAIPINAAGAHQFWTGKPIPF